MKNKNKSKVETSLPDRSPAAPATPRAADEFKLLAWGDIHPDPDQPRKTFNRESLEELAASIKEQGIVQPLIVRLQKAKFKILEPDLHVSEWRVLERTPSAEHGEWTEIFKGSENHCYLHVGGPESPDLKDRYVLVAGERRWRASELASLDVLPCIVRDMDEKQKFMQQFIENAQRENVTALEEASALKRQLDDRRATDATFSPEKLAAELGMSRAGIYERLKLTRLHLPVREALLAGKISTSVAGEVAKLPTPAAQEKLLKAITDERSWQYPFSVRDVQDLIDDDFVKQLDKAPFKQDKPFLILDNSIANRDCVTCPHRTGNMVEQFPDLKARPNVCTQPDCFAAKCKAHWVQQSESLSAKGEQVFTEKEFKKVKSDYVADSDFAFNLFTRTDGGYGHISIGAVLGKHAPEPVHVTTAKGIEKFYKIADMPDAAKRAKIKMRPIDRRTEALTPEQKAAAEAKEKAENERRDRREAFVLAHAPKMVKALQKLNAEKSWQFARILVEGISGYYDDRVESLFPYHKEKDARLGMLFRLVCDEENFPVTYDGFKESVVDAWIIAGIDLVKEFEASEKSAQKALPLPAKKSLEQGSLLKVKANKKPKAKK